MTPILAQKILEASLEYSAICQRCPSVSDLVEERLLKPSQTTDPWGRTFVIRCTASDVEVRSSGNDHRFDTSDDIARQGRRGCQAPLRDSGPSANQRR